MCNCINRVNAKLADYNGTLDVNLLATPSRTTVGVCKIVSRGKKPPIMEASYCPFCGDKYKDLSRSLASKSLAAAKVSKP